MRVLRLTAATGLLLLTSVLSADTVVLRNGQSYQGKYGEDRPIVLTDSQGVRYEFPVRDVQSIAFAGTTEVVTLRNGQSHSGTIAPSELLRFQDAQGVAYQFPARDVDAVIFNTANNTGTEPAAKRHGEVREARSEGKIISSGSDISVLTNETIDSDSAYEGQTYSARITEPVLDEAGGVAVPAGAAATLYIRRISAGGAISTPEVVLDLQSVSVDKKRYRVVTSDVYEKNRKGVGANRRTAEFLGGGAALGTLLGGIFGGGKGAGIGALAGAGGGFAGQMFTRGKQVKIPAETTLRFRLEQPLLLRPE